MFNIDLQINECHDIPLIRHNDKAIMECFLLDCGRYGPKQLVTLNIYRKFKQVHSLADITCCDGQSIDPKVVLHIFQAEVQEPFPMRNRYVCIINCGKKQ